MLDIYSHIHCSQGCMHGRGKLSSKKEKQLISRYLKWYIVQFLRNKHTVLIMFMEGIILYVQQWHDKTLPSRIVDISACKGLQPHGGKESEVIKVTDYLISPDNEPAGTLLRCCYQTSLWTLKTLMAKCQVAGVDWGLLESVVPVNISG